MAQQCAEGGDGVSGHDAVPLASEATLSGDESMRYRTFGRLGWRVSEVGYGMWGLAGWTGSDDKLTRAALDEAVRLGCNFFDTAWAYGSGSSERFLGELVRSHPDVRLYTATKIPPKNQTWPSRAGFTLDDVFPPDHIRRYTEWSLENLGLDAVDLLQFHVWEDAWATDERWQRVIEDLKRQRLIGGAGISVNRWEPENGLATLRTGLIDAVQVIYNIFDQAPEDVLFPLCRELGVAVIARVPFDEGSLAGNLTRESRFPDGDFRRIYFGPENLGPTMDRVDAVLPLVPANSTLPEMALRFVLADPDVATVIPGMRRPAHVAANIRASDLGPLAPELVQRLRDYRWTERRRPGRFERVVIPSGSACPEGQGLSCIQVPVRLEQSCPRAGFLSRTSPKTTTARRNDCGIGRIDGICSRPGMSRNEPSRFIGNSRSGRVRCIPSGCSLLPERHDERAA